MLAIVTALMAFVPGLLFVAIAPAADHVVNTSATLVAAGVAVLAWIRYRETGELDSVFQASAFTVLFTGGALSILLLVTGQDTSLGFGRANPGQAPLYVWTAVRLAAAPLLLVAAITALRPQTWKQPPKRKAAALAVLAPTAVLLTTSAALLGIRDALPQLVPTAALQQLTQGAVATGAQLVSQPMLLTQLGVALILLLAALLYGAAYGRWRGDRPYYAYLAVGLVVAAFSQLHFGIAPGSYSDLLSSADVLRAIFYGVVGFGVAAAARRDLVELREANARLGQLSAAEQQRIALEERARLAREVHDGLVQDLWLARLTHGRLRQALDASPKVPAEARENAARIDSILEDALAEARQAVASLQPQGDQSFGALLVRFVEDYGDRFGLEVNVELDGEPVVLAAQQQAEVLRICREALNNARKHADASVVTVRLEHTSPGLRLSIVDNGSGFDASRAQRGFGLKGMRARALDIGAKLHIDSEPHGGTRVTLELPGVERPPSGIPGTAS